jgi:site-specific recombinase XerD
MRRHTAILWFRWFRHASGIKKKVTAHTLRHTVATTLLFNGCPISHVKEILGHERLQTTCTYYLGTDRRAAKAAYLRCLRYDAPIKADSGSPVL